MSGLGFKASGLGCGLGEELSGSGTSNGMKTVRAVSIGPPRSPEPVLFRLSPQPWKGFRHAHVHCPPPPPPNSFSLSSWAVDRHGRTGHGALLVACTIGFLYIPTFNTHAHVCIRKVFTTEAGSYGLGHGPGPWLLSGSE